MSTLDKLQKRQDYLNKREQLIQQSAAPLSTKIHAMGILQAERLDLEKKIVKALAKLSAK